MQEAYELTMTHNENLKEFYFNALLEMSPNAAFAIERGQVNSSIGIPRGATPMEAISFRLEKDPKQKSEAELHNEHTEERTNEAKKALEIFFDKKLTKEQKKAKIKELVTSGGQFLIDKKLQGEKDSDKYGGKVGRISTSDAVNTLVISGRAQDVVYLRGENAGKTASEVFIEQGGLEIAKKILKDIPYENLKTADQVRAKQAAEYYKEKNLVKKENIEVVKEASMASKDLTQSEMLNELNKRDKAFRLANERSKTIKKARVFDFDDTIARSKSKVFAERDGKKKTLTAEEFAKRGEKLISEGWKMDFTDFNKVVEGKKGPLADLALKRAGKFGTGDIYVLTARPQEAAYAIHAFLKGIGLEIPIDNITGLEDGRPEAKADWIINKVAEGYNDFYFADDAFKNVEAVRNVFDVLDVKSDVQQARVCLLYTSPSPRD